MQCARQFLPFQSTFSQLFAIKTKTLGIKTSLMMYQMAANCTIKTGTLGIKTLLIVYKNVILQL